MKIPRWFRVGLIVLPWAAAVVCLGWLASMRLSPGGAFGTHFVFDGTHPWMDPFVPAERVTPAGPQTGGWTGQRLLQDPVYASARAPGLFDRVNVTLEAKTTNQPFLEFGLLRDPASFAFELHPLWSEALSKGWRAVSVSSTHGSTSSPLVGYVKEGMPDQTLVTARDDQRLTWGATTTPALTMDPGSTERAYPISFVGSHDFYFIPTSDGMRIVIRLENLATGRTGPLAQLHIFHHDREVGWMVAETKPNQSVYDETINFEKGAASPGVYRVTVLCDTQVAITQVTTPASHWVVGPGVTFGSAKNTLFATNSFHLVAQTAQNEGLQTLGLGSATATLKEISSSVRLDRAPNQLTGAQTLTVPNGNVRVIGDGYFSPDAHTLFYPSPRRLTDVTDLDREGIVAVVTSYIQPESTADGWKKLSATFDGLSGDQFKFLLSAPGLKMRGGSVDIRAADLRYQRTEGKSFWTILRNELSLIRQRL